MKCPNCGKEIRDNAAFCGYCGTRIGTEESAGITQIPSQSRQPSQPSQPPASPYLRQTAPQSAQPKKKHTGLLIAGIAAALLIVAAAVLAVLFWKDVLTPPEFLSGLFPSDGAGRSSVSDSAETEESDADEADIEEADESEGAEEEEAPEPSASAAPEISAEPELSAEPENSAEPELSAAPENSAAPEPLVSEAPEPEPAAPVVVSPLPSAVPTEAPLPPEENAVFAAYQGDLSDYEQVYPLSAAASSELYFNGKLYSATNVIDGDLGTSWQEDVEGDGIGVYLMLFFEREETVDLLSFNLGYTPYYERNGRPRTMRIEFSDGTGGVWEFEDLNDTQYIKLLEPIKTQSIKFTILSAYTGSEWSDTCITEIGSYRSGS